MSKITHFYSKKKVDITPLYIMILHKCDKSLGLAEIWQQKMCHVESVWVFFFYIV